jgi:hypothetical protein
MATVRPAQEHHFVILYLDLFAFHFGADVDGVTIAGLPFIRRSHAKADLTTLDKLLKARVFCFRNRGHCGHDNIGPRAQSSGK